MKRLPLLVVLAIALPTAPAYAKAAKPVCNLVVDDSGDSAPAPDGSLDIKSADIASDSKKISAVIRLDGVPSGVDPAAPNGRVYTVQFTGQGGENHVFLTYVVTPAAAEAVYGHYDPSTNINSGDGAATFKVVGNTVVLTTSIGNFSAYGKFKPKAKITGIEVLVGRMMGAYVNSGLYGYNTQVADQASGSKSYVAGTRSCLKVGG